MREFNFLQQQIFSGMVNQNENSPKQLNIWLPLLFSLVLIGGMLIGINLRQAPVVASKEKVPIITTIEPGRVEELIRYVEAKYVDDVNREELTEKAIDNLLKQLDPHSNYITAKQLKEVNEQLDGNFEGIGIEFMILDDTILVVTPISGGPSEAAGVLAGDKIVEIEDSLVAGEDAIAKDVIGMLRGDKGTKVKIGVKRGIEPELKHFTIIRDKIPIHSVETGYMLNDKTGYIKLSRFSATTYREFMETLEKMVEEEEMQDLVIDLRQNPGGYLQEATNILSQLFNEKDRLLVYTEGRTVKRNDYESTGKPFFKLGNIAVLIDEGSASASEILAGAIQDWDRGVIIGRRSFGKGLVQEQYSLKDGSALRLTVARYYTPSGRSIQKNYDDHEAYGKDVYDRYGSGELYSQDSIQVADTTSYFTLKEGRIVYGGGGITPDIFVPLDTFYLNDYYVELRQFLPQYIYRFIDENKDDFEYTLKEFKSLFSVTNKTLEDFLSYAESKGVERNNQELKASKEALKTLFKARIAKQLFGDEGYYSVWNEEDPVVMKALDALKQPDPLTYR